MATDVGRRVEPVWRTQGAVLTGMVVVSLVAIVFAALHPAPPVIDTARSQLQGLARIVLTAVLGATLLLGPGLVLRARVAPLREAAIGFVPLPGIGLLALLGLWVWLGPDLASDTVAVRVALVAVLVVTAGFGLGRRDLVSKAELRVLALAAVVLVIALGKVTWSLGPEGELYGGENSRTYEVGDRSDARISYHVATIVTHE